MGNLNRCVECCVTRKHFAHTINFSVISVSVVGGGFVLTLDARMIVRSVVGAHGKVSPLLEIIS